MLRTRCAAMISCIATCLVLATPASATPATPQISIEQQGALQVRLTSSTGSHWAWTILDASGATVATAAENPATVSFPGPGDYTALLDATDDDPFAPGPAGTKAAFHVYAAPVASFSATQLNDGSVQLVDASTGEPTAWSWSVPGGKQLDGRVPPPVTLPVGTTTVSLKVGNPAGEHSVSLPVLVNGPPQPVLTIYSSPAAIGAPVLLDASRSTDPNQDALSFSWDLDGDGRFGEGAGAVQTVSYALPGRYRVAVQVTDGRGGSAIADAVITVLTDQAPTVTFVNDPLQPLVGATATFTATASDPDGSVAGITWDLDDDGRFDDAAGATATWTFRAAGPHRVAVRAVDDRGVATVAFRTVDVVGPTVLLPPPPVGGGAPAQAAPDAPTAAASTPTALRATLLAPFPVVRLRGQMFHGAVRISLLKVQAPAGATIRVRCRGGSCKAKKADVRVTAARAAVRVRSLEGRRLRAGTIVEIYVTAPKQIGKFTRFRIRREAAPARTDLCLAPGSTRPTACPTA